MRIQILSIDIKTIPTTKGSYQAAEVAYKNLSFQGKVEGRKIMSFGAAAETFKTLATAQSGNIFEITVVKNDKGFNDWTQANPATADSAEARVDQPNYPGVKPTSGAATRSTYETPEERAQKQIWIVRQSTLSNAVNCLSSGAKSPPKVEEVLALAKQFENHVFNTGVEEPTNSIEDMEDDVI